MSGGEAKLARMALPWRTVPAACLPPISVGAVLGESVQFVFCFPLLPSGSFQANDEKVWSMPDNLPFPIGALVVQRNCVGSIENSNVCGSCSIS